MGEEEIIEKKVQQIVEVEKHIEVPKVTYEEEIIERRVPMHREIQRVVEVPFPQEKIIEVPVEQIQEEIVYVDKITYEDEIIETPIAGKLKFETRYVEKPII